MEVELSNSDNNKDGAPPTKKAKQGAGEEKENADAEAESAEKKPATTHILTPADLAKLTELRAEASINAALPGLKSRHAGQNNSFS